MMTRSLTDADLLAYLDEMLPPERSAEIESLLRERADLRQRAAMVSRRRDSGGHSVGEIWRRRQLSCPSRETLGMFVLGVADPDLEDYILFHTEVSGCRICQANVQDLKQERTASSDQTQRRKRYFESSAGVLRSQRSQ